MPRAVVGRAKEILKELEAQGSDFSLRQGPGEQERRPKGVPREQLSMFQAGPHPAVQALLEMRVEEMSPLEAMTKLYELQRLARSSS